MSLFSDVMCMYEDVKMELSKNDGEFGSYYALKFVSFSSGNSWRSSVFLSEEQFKTLKELLNKGCEDDSSI